MHSFAQTLTIRELAPEQLPDLFALITVHNPSVTRPVFDRRLATMVAQGYRAIGAYHGETLVGCCGFWQRTRFWCGGEFDIDNFIVHADHRGQKIGEAMLQWLEAKAIEAGADLIVLDTYADSFLAQRFYIRHGFSLTGYHMTKIPGSDRPFEKKR